MGATEVLTGLDDDLAARPGSEPRRYAGTPYGVVLGTIPPHVVEYAAQIVQFEIASVQNPFSSVRQDDRAVLDHCAQNGIAYLAYSPVGGHGSAKKLDELHPPLAKVAEARGVPVQQVALAWLLAQSPTVVPLAGSSRRESVLSSAAAAAWSSPPRSSAS